MRPIYLDYMATTPIDPDVAKIMYEAMLDPDLQSSWTSQHHYGKQVNLKRKTCLDLIASILDADPQGIVITSSATESIQSVIQGTLENYHRSGNHFVSLTNEHHATLAALDHVQKQGAKVTLLQTQQDGLVDMQTLLKSLTSETLMVTLSYVNSEIGVIQPIHEIAQICQEKGILLHVDATQAIGKIPVSFQEIGADYMSFSAHKFYGPRAIGGLICKTSPNRQFTSMIRSHKSQANKRPGTESISQLVGMTEALMLADKSLTERSKHVEKLSNKLIDALGDIVTINGSLAKRVPHNLNFDTHLSQTKLAALMEAFALSQASACTNTSLTNSHVLRSIGVKPEAIQRSVRLSLSHLTSEADISQFIHHFKELSS